MKQEQQENLSSIWTLKVEMSVMAGDMDKADVISIAEQVLADITDGSDIIGFSVVDAERDQI